MSIGVSVLEPLGETITGRDNHWERTFQSTLPGAGATELLLLRGVETRL